MSKNASRINPENIQSVRFALRECLKKEQEELHKALTNLSEIKLETRKENGVKTPQNDRRDYYWIVANTGGKEYWLTLFYNEVDEKSGNIHTQLGRIQFWKNIQGKTPNGFINYRISGRTSPDERQSVFSSNKVWFLIIENSSQPQNKPTYIGTEEYCSQTVVDSFLEFIRQDMEDSKCKKK